MTEQRVQTGSKMQLHARCWTPKDRECIGHLVVIHGLGAHGGRYAHIAARVARAGWGTFAPDLPGHGQSSGRRGHIKSYLRVLHEIHSICRTARSHFAHGPQVLLGHSMGGNLAVNYLLRQKEFAPECSGPAGLVLSAPMFLPINPPNRSQIFAAWLTGHAIPWFTFKAPISQAGMTRDPNAIELAHRDPLLHRRISVYLATQLLAQGRYALDHADQLDVPTLVMHGEDDPVTSYRCSESFAFRVGKLASYHMFPGRLHELFNDHHAEEVFEVMIDWLRQRIDHSE